MSTIPTPTHYREPDWFTRNVMNRCVMGLTRLGVSVWGSRILEVRGRRSGLPRRNPVNLLAVEGRSYLVAPRGDTEWVRNARGAGEVVLLLGRRRDHYVAHELADEEKPRILRAYVRRWRAESGVFFDGATADSSDDEIARIAPRHPVFRLEPEVR
ncbi:MAG TPA: nitroreductase family deazaflavin-dependent oxidoreductase [Acidimicrobiia bacterium]|jgi:deazaflavin-dependent oxidoreductase (nitroreductase family)